MWRPRSSGSHWSSVAPPRPPPPPPPAPPPPPPPPRPPPPPPRPRLHRGVESAEAAVREMWEPPAFFEQLGVRYTGPIDGHDSEGVERALRHAAEWDGPIVVHVLTQKGRGYPPAEADDEKNLHDVSGVFNPETGPQRATGAPATYTQAFTDTLLDLADKH